MNRLMIKDRARIIGMLVEGMSLRAITRLTGVSINTVTKLLVDAGKIIDGSAGIPGLVVRAVSPVAGLAQIGWHHADPFGFEPDDDAR